MWVIFRIKILLITAIWLFLQCISIGLSATLCGHPSRLLFNLVRSSLEGVFCLSIMPRLLEIGRCCQGSLESGDRRKHCLLELIFCGCCRWEVEWLRHFVLDRGKDTIFWWTPWGRCTELGWSFGDEGNRWLRYWICRKRTWIFLSFWGGCANRISFHREQSQKRV